MKENVIEMKISSAIFSDQCLKAFPTPDLGLGMQTRDALGVHAFCEVP